MGQYGVGPSKGLERRATEDDEPNRTKVRYEAPIRVPESCLTSTVKSCPPWGGGDRWRRIGSGAEEEDPKREIAVSSRSTTPHRQQRRQARPERSPRSFRPKLLLLGSTPPCFTFTSYGRPTVVLFVSTIPKRYIKPPSERPNLNPGTAMAAGETECLPVVDLGGLRGGAAERQATMRAVSDACREWGFFQAVNHGVSPALTAAVREAWRQFFHLPMAEKQAYANSPATFEGYGSRLGVKKGAILDWGDYFFLQLLPQSIKNYDKWPTLPASLSRETTNAYGEELVKLCGVIKEVLSLTLGMDEGFLHRGFGEPGACLRVNYYPRCLQPELTLGLSPHSDPGGMTILLTDEHVKGLQVRKGDDWITVQPIPDALIVNIGDQIQVRLLPPPPPPHPA
ncbi:hypothetical protein BHE74_00002445 [Ensete ventricosum]|nr:hypothetical protein BHE74_00002445 [Ensete ventricosum]